MNSNVFIFKPKNCLYHIVEVYKIAFQPKNFVYIGEPIKLAFQLKFFVYIGVEVYKIADVVSFWKYDSFFTITNHFSGTLVVD
jgi:hypothetical protein